MKRLLPVVFCCAYLFSQAQKAPFSYQPYFSAVVVKNLETSSKWYQSVFDLKVKTEMKDPNQVYNIAILESPVFALELLELKGSLVKGDFLKDKPQGTEIQGHFKIGFRISDVTHCLKRLKELNIEVPNVWTDQGTGKKNFLIKDPDGNLIQFFE